MKTLFSRLLAAALIAAAALSAQAATVTDIAGRKVEVPAKVNRILLGEGRLFYALALLEGKQPLARIAGWQGDFRQLDPQTYAQYKKRFPEIDRIPLIGKTSENSVSAEKVLTLKPDIAIFSISGHGPGLNNPIVQQLQAAKVPVVFVDFRNAPLEHTVPSLRIMGKALQREAEAERFIRFYQSRIDAIRKTVAAIPAQQKPKVFLDLRAAAFPNVTSAGKGSLGELVDAAGGVNIGDKLIPGAVGEVNMEHVLASKPDWYIGTGTADAADKIGVQFGADISPAQARASLARAAARKPVGA
ncbi:ABC transporter substrate-binding protein, partial [Chromobacterium piscinae]